MLGLNTDVFNPFYFSMSKNAKIILVILLVLVVVFVGWRFRQNSSSEAALKIGAILPLSGPAAYYGEQIRNGLEIAKAGLEQKYPDMRFNIFYEDSFYTPKGGIDAYQKLRNVQSVDGVIVMASQVAIPLQPLVTKDGILEMAVAATSPKYSSPNDLTFRVSPGFDADAVTLVNFLEKQRVNRLAMLSVNNDFGLGGQIALKGELQKRKSSIQIVSDENYLADASDVRTQLTKIKQARPEAIYILGIGQNYVTILKQAKEVGLEQPLMTIRSAEDPVVLKNAAKEAEQMVYSYTFDQESAEAKTFVTAYQARYGEVPSSYAAEGYEALNLTLAAFAKCQKNYSCIQSFLSETKDYPSVFGDLSFDSHGDVHLPPSFLKTVRDGKFVKVE